MISRKAAASLRQAVECHRQGRLAEGERLYRAVLREDPRHFDALHLLGLLRLQQGKPDDAATLMRKAIAIDPSYAVAHSNLGLALQGLGRFEEAVASYGRAVALAPDLPEAHNNCGLALHALGRDEAAAACYRRAIALRPGYAEAHDNCGNALRALRRPDEAVACYERALALAPADPATHYNYGGALLALGRNEDAIARYEAALALDPDFAAARLDAGMARLGLGRFEAGLRDYEWRWRAPAFAASRRDFTQPLWLGEGGLAGRTILLHAEQGLGDTLQFLRYGPLVARLGARIVLEVQPPFLSLLAGSPWISALRARGEALPPFDCHCPLMSLPLAFRTRLETIPAEIPYLFPPADRLEAWRSRLPPGDGPVIGLAWSGNPANEAGSGRSLPFPALAPLLAIPGARFVVLQKEFRAGDAEAAGRLANVALAADRLADFADTAALVARVDLVVTIDTAVAHLAGALGKEVWILLPFATDWRWLRERSDSPWYPSARLFRQARPGDWSTVLARVEAALAARIAEGPAV